MQDYVEILEAQYQSLQSLVAELLLQNQQLREELEKRPAPFVEPAIQASQRLNAAR